MQISNLYKKVCGLCLLFLALYGYGQKIEKSIFITANTGTADNTTILSQITKDAATSNEAILLILGNAIPKGGFTGTSVKGVINQQLELLTSFNGEIIFTPGHHEWGSDGRGVREMEKFIQKNSKAKMYPDEGCPIKAKDITDDVVLITIDSQWFLEDWNNHIYLNQDCHIKNRTDFFLAFEGLLKKSQNKTKIIAIHHPIHSSSRQGLFSKTAGFSTEDFQNQQRRNFRNRILTMARQNTNVLFVSGRDKNLQYINKKGVPQIISGAVGNTIRAKAVNEGDFASTENGYARIDVNGGGGLQVSFKGTKKLFSTDLFFKKRKPALKPFKSRGDYVKNKSASVYSKDETKKSGFYKALFGKHYREYYGIPVKAEVVFIDTLMGGLTPIRRGGGHQSKSLRLADKNGKQYVMRALRKSAIKFLQASTFQDKYIQDNLEGSVADRFVLDYFTTAHPYTPFIIGNLADKVNVFHSNPNLYYIPKQKRLGDFNDEFGDELYMIEERMESSHSDVASFGYPHEILSTPDVLQEIHKNGKTAIDEPTYIRSRLFDMLIGDWDRHSDQWRWASFKKEDGSKLLKPIPRDRDQAFSIFDGGLISFLTRALPALRKMQSFDENLRSPKWFNFEVQYLDMNFVNESNWSEWEKQAKFLQEHLTNTVIEDAFKELPNEMKGKTIDEIKAKLKGRRSNIVDIAREYYKYLNKLEVIAGTQKDDSFEVKRLANGRTTIDVHRKDRGIFKRTFTKEETKEIWLYGLDGNDKFTVDGEGDNLIKIRIMGGKKNDTYNFINNRKVKLYDYKSKNNTIVNKHSKKWLVDDYEINNYDLKKRKHNINQLLPIIGVNPDDGLRIGFTNTFSTYGLQRNPFTTRHLITASYYTSNSGYDIMYKGEFSNIFHNWNFGIETKYTGPNFAQNFFGFGNETEYDKDVVELDFNRVRIEQLKAALALIWRGRNGGYFHFKSLIESFEVENTEDRFINTIPSNALTFERQSYAGAEVSYAFKNKNNVAFPTYGLDMEITAGYKDNIDGGLNENKFGYIQSHFAVDHKLSKGGNLVLATKIGGEAILGDDFEFYHGASLGGNHSLRGFRNERFIGKYSTYQNTDLRLKLGRLKTSFIPMSFGITTGFDYGRVWVENDTSDKWNNSVGGSLWIKGLDTFTGNIGYYGSNDGGRIVFTFGFEF